MEWYRDDLEEAFKKDPFPKLRNDLSKASFTEEKINQIEKKCKV